MQKLDQYLSNNFENGIIDFALRVSVNTEGQVSFIIHPAYVPGQTLDFLAEGNSLTCITAPSVEPQPAIEIPPVPYGWDKV